MYIPLYKKIHSVFLHNKFLDNKILHNKLLDNKFYTINFKQNLTILWKQARTLG